MARTDTLGHFLTDVADAIRTKTGSAGTITASSFDTAIENIPSGGGVDEYIDDELTNFRSESCGKWMWLIKKLPQIKSVDSTSTSLSDYFRYCYADTITFAPTFDTTNITNMSSMFFSCANITSLDVSMFNTSNVTTMFDMFIGCEKCTNINVSSFDTRKVTSMDSMFNSMKALTYLDLSNFETPLLTNTSKMFNWCPNLMHIDMRKFDFTNVTNSQHMFGNNMSGANVPNNCEIIVADATQKTWMNTNFSRMNNVKTVAEYEAEQQSS